MNDIKERLQDVHTKIPERLVISPLKWKYLVRSVLRGKNVMMTGPSGCGKTLAAQSVAAMFSDRPFFYINVGATQDPRITLIGNTHFSKDKGTFVTESYFVQAIKTPNAIILLDELTRAHPDAWNILMTVLDENQRYLRIDEQWDSPTIKVAEGVCFISTANIGAEYTATRVLDRALLDRFTCIVEMQPLELEQEVELLQKKFPDVDKKYIHAICSIAEMTRIQVRDATQKVSTALSTRSTVEMAGLINDGFSLEDAAEVSIIPLFPDVGGTDSERVFVKQHIQMYLEDGKDPNGLLRRKNQNQANKPPASPPTPPQNNRPSSGVSGSAAQPRNQNANQSNKPRPPF